MNNFTQEFSFLDLMNVASFLLALENLNANLTQNDKAELQHDLANKAEAILKEIHLHLERQDLKINSILQKLEELKHDS